MKRVMPWLLVVAAFAGWMFLFGHHRHVVQIYRGHAVARMTSHRSPFVVSVGGQPAPSPQEGSIGFQDDELSGNSMRPQVSEGRGIVLSKQTVVLDESSAPFSFEVNGRMFRMEGDTLHMGDHGWQLKEHVPVEIDLDEIK